MAHTECPLCEGEKSKPCGACDGEGLLEDEDSSEVCRVCRGEGTITCGVCGGKGYLDTINP